MHEQFVHHPAHKLIELIIEAGLQNDANLKNEIKLTPVFTKDQVQD